MGQPAAAHPGGRGEGKGGPQTGGKRGEVGTGRGGGKEVRTGRGGGKEVGTGRGGGKEVGTGRRGGKTARKAGGVAAAQEKRRGGVTAAQEESTRRKLSNLTRAAELASLQQWRQEKER